MKSRAIHSKGTTRQAIKDYCSDQKRFAWGDLVDLFIVRTSISSAKKVLYSNAAMNRLRNILIISVLWLSMSGWSNVLAVTKPLSESVLADLDGSVRLVLARLDHHDGETAWAASLDAKTKVWKMGDTADLGYAMLVVRGLEERKRKDETFVLKSTLLVEELLRSLANSPNVSPVLVPVLRSWMADLADGKLQEPSPGVIRAVATYLLVVDEAGNRDFLEKVAKDLEVREQSDERYWRNGERVRYALKHKGDGSYVLSMPMHQWCGKIVEHARRDAGAKSAQGERCHETGYADAAPSRCPKGAKLLLTD